MRARRETREQAKGRKVRSRLRLILFIDRVLNVGFSIFACWKDKAICCFSEIDLIIDIINKSAQTIVGKIRRYDSADGQVCLLPCNQVRQSSGLCFCTLSWYSLYINSLLFSRSIKSIFLVIRCVNLHNYATPLYEIQPHYRKLAKFNCRHYIFL